jgi:uncharacterized protein (DUF362 family)
MIDPIYSAQFCKSRRDFLRSAIESALAISLGFFHACNRKIQKADVFIGKADDYSADICSVLRTGFRGLGVTEQEIRGKRILLKVNMVEPHKQAQHIVTHPAVAVAAAEAFLSMGAAKIIVAEGSGHCRDTYRILEEARYGEIFLNKKIAFADLNYDDWLNIANAGRASNLKSYFIPATLKKVDWIVSMPKLKIHHWVGATLSMKNLFGILPGVFYGWPKNVLHTAGITETIFDLNATLRPQFAIVDGIVGMEGDGPIMGNPRKAGVLVMGRNLPAVDATCARLMGINPHKLKYLSKADGKLGPIKESLITQRGYDWRAVRTDFQLLDYIEAHRGIRLA